MAKQSRDLTPGPRHHWVMYERWWPRGRWWLGYGATTQREVEQAAQIEFAQGASRIAVHYDAQDPVYFTSIAEVHLHHQAQNPFSDLSDAPRFRRRKRPDRPTVTQLADLLEQLTREGMPPRLQARHVAQHWPGSVRKEDTE